MIITFLIVGNATLATVAAIVIEWQDDSIQCPPAASNDEPPYSIPSPRDCSQFYLCIGNISMLCDCPVGLHFNPKWKYVIGLQIPIAKLEVSLLQDLLDLFFTSRTFLHLVGQFWTQQEGDMIGRDNHIVVSPFLFSPSYIIHYFFPFFYNKYKLWLYFISSLTFYILLCIVHTS